MARQNLSAALDLVFGDEGGYSNRSTDSGGPTKYGITHRTLAAHRGVASVTAAQVQALTRDEAADIYRKSYWGQSGGDLLPSGLDYAAFDFGVNSGPARAVKTLQRLIGVPQDGVVGGQTVAAINRYQGGIEQLIRDYCDARMVFLRGLGGKAGFAANGRGWTIRVTGKDPKGQWAAQPGVIGHALALARGLSYGDAAGTTADASPAGSAKANPSATSLTRILEKPEAIAPIGAAVASLGSVVSGEGPFQYALAAAVVALVAVGVFFFIRRVRADG